MESEQTGTEACPPLAGGLQMAAPPGGYAPPWLFIWGLLVLSALPGWFDYYLFAGHALAVTLSGTGEGERMLALLPMLAQLLPMLALAVAVLLLLLPGLRGRYVEWRYRITDCPAAGPVADIAAEVRRLLPSVEVTCARKLGERLLAAYPRSLRRPRIAITAPFAELWQRERAAAETRLARELAHIAQGDHLVIGPGSLLDLLVRRFGRVLTLLVLLPVAIFWGLGGAATMAEFAAFEEQTGSHLAPPWWEVMGLWLPGVLTLAVELALWTAAWYAVFVGARWSAELNADRAADLPPHLEPRPGLPPPRLRRWLTADPARPAASLALLLIFPAAYLLRLGLLAATGPVAEWMPGSDLRAIDPTLYTRESLFLLPLFALVLLLWPRLGPSWEAMFTAGEPRDAARDRAYLLAALLLGALLLLWPSQAGRATSHPGGRMMTGHSVPDRSYVATEPPRLVGSALQRPG